MYLLKFKPQYFPKIWGGNKIQEKLGRDTGKLPNVGESWEISGIEGKASEVSNGYLAENGLDELVEVYMGDLVGEKVFDEFGLYFPLLVKFIDAADDLSVQVHPDDDLAQKVYGTPGKTEMWHVIHADEGAGLYVGFKKGVTKQAYNQAVAAGTVDALLEFHPVKAGDTFFIPAGTVHAIGKGVMVAEIQQASDITYRIFDWNRKDAQGHSRQLHLREAELALRFDDKAKYKIDYEATLNQTVPLAECKHFNVNMLHFNKPMEKVYAKLDSFVIYVCLDGDVAIGNSETSETLGRGECILVPAISTELMLAPKGEAKLLEIYL